MVHVEEWGVCGGKKMKRVAKCLKLSVLGWFSMLIIGAFVRVAGAKLVSSVAVATTPEPTAQQVVFTAVPTPMPEAPRKITVNEYDNDRAEIETLAKLLWSSPLRNEGEKKKLLWVVFNRIADQSNKFGFSIADVVTAHEFTFYDDGAHLSEENLRIANECMNAWKSEREGNYVGAHVPEEGVYIRFVGDRNRALEVTAERGGDALVW